MPAFIRLAGYKDPLDRPYGPQQLTVMMAQAEKKTTGPRLTDGGGFNIMPFGCGCCSKLN